jgi:hypothetical protein
VGERRARSTRWTASRRRLAATILAALGVLALALGAGLVGPWTLPAASHLLHPVTSPAPFPSVAVAVRFAGTLPALPPGPVPVALAAVSLPVGARLVLPAGPGPVLLGVEVGAVSARVNGSTALLAAMPEAVAPPFPVAAAGATAVPGLGAIVVAPAGAAIELVHVSGVSAAGAFVAFGTTDVAAADAAVRLIASGQLNPPPASPLRVEMTRWSLALGAIMPAQVVADPELLGVAAGSIVLALHPGEARIRRGYGGEERLSGGPGDPLASRPAEDAGHDHGGGSADPVRPAGPPFLHGSVAGLAAGDTAIVQPGSTRTLQGTGPDPAVVWVVALVPAR